MLRIRSQLSLLTLLLSSLAFGQTTGNDKIWRDFLEWMKTSTGSPIEGYRAKLIESGLTAAEADERVALIPKLYKENAEFRQQAASIGFNKLYSSPDQTRFTLQPNAFLVSVTKDMKPGKALDVAMGQGRNAVYLAMQGWDVTGFDIAEEGLKVAAENAAKAGARLTTVKTTFEGFDYGKKKWDLIYFVYTDAPTVDPGYVQRIRDAIKPGGFVLIDRPLRSFTDPEPGWEETEQDKINAFARAWSDMQIVFYQDTTEFADWQQGRAGRLEKKMRIMRLLARKP